MIGLVAMKVAGLLVFEVVAIPPRAFEEVDKDSVLDGPRGVGREGDHTEPKGGIVYCAAGGLRA